MVFGEYNGVFVTTPTANYQNVTNYPDIASRMNNLNLTANYQVATNMDWLLRVSYSTFTDHDWNDLASSVQGAGTAAVSILSPGYGPPNYHVETIMTAVRMRF